MNTNTNSIQNSWAETKAKIKAKWSKLTDSDIDGFKESLDQVAAQVQKTYGIAKEQAEKEFGDFKKMLHSATAPAKVHVEAKPDVSSKAV